jgi:hypothetical protein
MKKFSLHWDSGVVEEEAQIAALEEMWAVWWAFVKRFGG